MLVLQQPRYFAWALGLELSIPFCLFLVILFVTVARSLRNTSRNHWVTFAIAFVASYLCVFSIHIIAVSFWVPFRSVFGLWAVLSCFLLMPPLLLRQEQDEPPKGRIALRHTKMVDEVLPSAFSFLLFLAVCSVVYGLSNDMLITNESDAGEAKCCGAGQETGSDGLQQLFQRRERLPETLWQLRARQ